METAMEHPPATEQRHSWLGLCGLILALAAAAVVLYALAGPPHLPAQLPSWTTVWLTLRGSYLPLEVLAYVFTTAAWVLWLWIVASLALRAVALSVEAVAGGAAWVGLIRAVSDCVTLPIVRRLVDGAVVTVLVVNLAGRGTPSAAAAHVSASVVAVVASPGIGADAPRLCPAARERDERSVRYIVLPGDTLWGIAERFLGDGNAYPRLLAANVGREMPDGGRFDRTGVIRPGWVLAIPIESESRGEAATPTSYTVQPGDTLRSIAARALGDEMRWGEIFAANRGTARLADGRALTNPDLIWPGLRLELSRAAREDEPRPEPAASAPTVSTPVPSPVALPIVVSPTPPQAPAVGSSPTVVPPIVVSPMEEEPAASGGDHAAAALGAAVVAVAAGGAAVLARRRVRRRLEEPPVPPWTETPMREGFAEAEFARSLAHRLHGGEVEPAILVAEQVRRALGELGLDGVSILWTYFSHSGAMLTLSGGLAQRERLVEVAADIGLRLGASARAQHTLDHDVLLRLDGLKRVGLQALRADRSGKDLPLLPIGVMPSRETLFANWRELGHVLVAGAPGGGTATVLGALLAALAMRYPPDALHLLVIADRHRLPDEFVALPHLRRAVVDPADRAEVGRMLNAFQAQLDRRAQMVSDPSLLASTEEMALPELVLVIGELADVQDQLAMLDALGPEGPRHGLRIMAASEQPEALDGGMLASFDTRLVLEMPDEEQSITLLGTPEAADLGGGGRLLVRFSSRLPVRASGFRVSSEQMARLVQLMDEAYPTRPGGVGLNPCEQTTEMSVSAGETAPEAAPTEGIESAQAADAERNADALSSFQQGGDATDASSDAASDSQAASTPNSQLEQGREPALDDCPATRGDAGNGAATALIEVRCFGPFRVMAGERELTPEGANGGQYKAWETLAFIATQPGGVCAREKLYSALWPDADEEKLASRLSVTLVRLRQVLARQVPELASEVIRSERNGTCHLDTLAISSDAVRFWELCRAGRTLRPPEAKAAYEGARELYQADLLTEPLYEWVHARDDGGTSLQERYREEYYRITRDLAELYRREGQTAQAVRLYKSLLKAEPTLEEVVRSLYRCYRELGDRASLIREHRRLRQALREAYQGHGEPDDPDLCEPEPETVALYEESLADLEAKVAAPCRR